MAGTVQLEAGRLFLVGDPKQAIYRFRGADLRVYEAARARLGATALELTTSFRAVPGIIEFVNATFAGLMGDRFAPLQVDRESTGAPSPVRIVGGALENVSAAERRRAEGDAVADVILSAIGDPGWIVADESDGALRSAAARRHRHPPPEPDRPRHPRGRPRRAAHRLPGRERLARLRLAGGPRSARARPRHRRPRQRDGSRRGASLSGLRMRRRRSARVPARWRFVQPCGRDSPRPSRRRPLSQAAIRALRELRGMRHALGPVGDPRPEPRPIAACFRSPGRVPGRGSPGADCVS